MFFILFCVISRSRKLFEAAVSVCDRPKSIDYNETIKTISSGRYLMEMGVKAMPLYWERTRITPRTYIAAFSFETGIMVTYGDIEIQFIPYCLKSGILKNLRI